MGRSFKRKTEKKDPEILRRAVAAMKLGMPLRAAAREFEIPRSTLLLHRRNNENAKGADLPTEVNLENINITSKGFKTVCFYYFNLCFLMVVMFYLLHW